MSRYKRFVVGGFGCRCAVSLWQRAALFMRAPDTACDGDGLAQSSDGSPLMCLGAQGNRRWGVYKDYCSPADSRLGKGRGIQHEAGHVSGWRG